MRLGVTVGPSAQSPHRATGLLLPTLLSLILFTFATAAAQNSTPTKVSLQIIVVPSASEAEQLLERLNKGEDFATLARQKSNDATADDGGYMGKVDPKTLRPELRNALTSLASGKISGIIKLPSGYAILKIVPEGMSPAPANSNPTRILPLAATGSIRYPPSVGGKGEADLAFRYYPKPDNWSQDLRGLCSIRKQSLASAIGQLEKDSSLMSSDSALQGSPLDQIERHYALANLYAYQGIMNKSVAEWESAYQIAMTELPGAMPELEEVLGVAYLHKSEMENNVYSDPGNRCIFPPQAGVRYQETQASQESIEYLSKYLERKPDAYDVRWLLNLAYMTLGSYPDGVPKKYLIPPSAFTSTEDVGRFVDVAPAAGIKLFSESGGLIVDDFENNGLLDVVTSDYDQCAPMHFFHNNGDGTFADRTAHAGLADQLGGLNLVQADYNNDGCMDILVLRGAWEFPQRKSLLRNNCDGTFTDVTVASGLAEPATSTQTAVWADIDNDGFLDLLVGSENGPAQLFHNKGDGTFEDISHSAGVDEIAFTKGVTAADYDNDGYVDFYLSNLNGNNFLYHNNHNRTFTEIAQKAGVQKPWQSFATWFFDYDNDGWPDLFVSSYYISVDESVRTYLGLPLNAETLKLYRNLGDGTFRDVTAEVGLDKVFMPMGANFGDIDNDGYLDLYLGTGNPTYSSLLPNVLLRNKEGKSFVDVTASSGTGELHKGHAVAFADIDNDGDEDLLMEIGGAVPGDRHAFRLFENPGDGNDWINLHLVGVKTNRSAIGARIKLTVENEDHGSRSIYRTVGSGGSFGASPLQQHIGLGKSARIVDVEIWWPTSNTRQHFADVQKNQFLEIKEFAKTYAKLERPRYRLGGAGRETAVSPKPSAPEARK
jgi:PPIC-type PPIASE domain/ASPIC and UnbV/FG-GAP-like repeat